MPVPLKFSQKMPSTSEGTKTDHKQTATTVIPVGCLQVSSANLCEMMHSVFKLYNPWSNSLCRHDNIFISLWPSYLAFCINSWNISMLKKTNKYFRRPVESYQTSDKGKIFSHWMINKNNTNSRQLLILLDPPCEIFSNR